MGTLLSVGSFVEGESTSGAELAEEAIRSALEGMLSSALRLHRGGQLREAARIYAQILKIDSRHADSLHLLGMVACGAGMTKLAIELIGKAIAVNPNAAIFYSNLGSILQSQGRIEEAAAVYVRALELNPAQAETHMNLGLALETQGKLEEAVAEYHQAVALDEALAEAHGNLGNALQAMGRLDEAIPRYLHALTLRPEFAEAHYNLANAYLAQNRLEAAETSFRRALTFKPDLAEAHCNLGNALQRQERLEEAVESYERALELRSVYPEAHYNLANVLAFQKKPHEAVAHYGLALRQNPHLVRAHNNLGNLYRTLEQPELAVPHYLQVPESDPEFTDAYNNLGLAYLSLGHFAEAEEAIRRTLRLKPDQAEAYCNLGAVRHAQNHLDEATVCYQRALACKSTLSKAQLNLGLVQLTQGDLRNGWINYELRWEDAPLHRREFARPQWKGEPLAGRRILLHAEQGLGDTLQFLRYLPMVQAAGGEVILEVQERLLRLAAELPGAVQPVRWGDPLPEFDLHCPLLSLPLAFQTTLESIPANIPYLRVPADAQARANALPWAKKGPRIGLQWAGNPSFRHDPCRYRTLPLAEFRSLFELSAPQFYSLQIGDAVAELAAQPEFSARIVDLSPHVEDMADSAAHLLHLDLLITADTSIAHLAGALGIPVWVLVPSSPDWRWMLDREDSPWYPTMRLFRQPTPGDFPSVVARIRRELEAFCQQWRASRDF